MPELSALPSTLTLQLLPTAEDLVAVHALFEAYRRMLTILEDVRRQHGLRANVVALTERSYPRLRDETGLPARMITLGIREFARKNDVNPADVDAIPLDHKLYGVKSASNVTLSTLTGRRIIAYRADGYGGPWREPSTAYLTAARDDLAIRVGVVVSGPQREEKRSMPETMLTRVGRIIGGLSNAALDAVEGRNGEATAQQALREIDDVIHEARLTLWKIKAENHRLTARRGQLSAELDALPAKLKTALSSGRDDLARSGVARQIDLESQIEAIDSGLASVAERHGSASKALQAANAARRDAEHRIALLRAPQDAGADALVDYGDDDARTRRLEHSLRAIDRLTGTVSSASNAAIEDLDRLHRDHAIEERLLALRADGSP